MYVLLLFFIVFNFIIYHKIFRVIYFDLAKGLSKEIFWCILLSPFEAAIVVVVGPYILVALGVILAICTMGVFYIPEILGIVFAFHGKKQGVMRTQVKSGLICSIISIVMLIIIFILAFIFS